MKEAYQKWIQQNVTNPKNKCKEYSEQMQKAFPELRLVRGYYECPFQVPLPHWWLITDKDEVIDPTAQQFKSAGHGEYRAYNEDLGEPVGKCVECGELYYEEKYALPVCSEVCRRAAALELNNRWRFGKNDKYNL